jgi:AraC-like DNA-binding protein
MELSESVTFVSNELLIGISSLIGRIACLATFRDPQTRIYHDARVAARFGLDKTNHGMRAVHELLWNHWMRHSIEQQHADVLFYLSTLPTSVESLLLTWRDSRLYATFLPDCASQLERNLFTNNLYVVLELLYNQHTSSHPTTSIGPSNVPVPKQVVSMIHSCQTNPKLSLTSLSVSIGISERHIRRIIKEGTGQTFRRYLRQLRMVKAAQVLTNSSYDIKMVAGVVGYSDASHFGEDFRTWMGCTPGEFRTRVSRATSAYTNLCKGIRSCQNT